MILPSRCGACDAVGPSPCPTCVEAMERCRHVPLPPGLDSCRALLRYEGPAREVVARLKYRNRRSSVRWMAESLADLVRGDGLDVVTWAPTTRERSRARGFDHAEILARRVAVHLGVPSRRLLRRSPGPAQTGRDRSERSVGPGFSPLRSMVGASVLIVDDVVTTGATLSSAARSLRSAGAVRVAGLAVAHPSRR